MITLLFGSLFGTYLIVEDMRFSHSPNLAYVHSTWFETALVLLILGVQT
jgi:hypothetical protein